MLGALLRRFFPAAPTARAGLDFFAPEDLPLADGVRDPLLEQACLLAAQGDTARARSLLDRSTGSAGLALLGALLERLGDAAGAEAAWRSAVQSDAGKPAESSVAQHFYARGRWYLNQLKPYSAARCLELAHRLMPSASAPVEMLGLACYRTGDTKAGERWYGKAVANAPLQERGALRIKALIDTIPQIYESVAHVAHARESFEAGVDALLADPPRVASYEAMMNTTPFYLSYQGRDDHELLGKVASLFVRACPALEWTAPHVAHAPSTDGRKLRVAFVSAYLSAHSVGSWYSGLVRRVIESGRFEVSLFTLQDVEPRLADSAARLARHVPLDKSLDRAREQIAETKPDVLVHTDVQMHPRIYPLAFSRLARLQCALVGHPSSTGLPSIDRFVSNVFQDAEGAQAHYSERLVRLPRIAAWVEQTRPPSQPMSREQLGLSSALRYYACPMKLQKMHPDFDAAIQSILERDGNGRFVLFEDPDKPLWKQQLVDRLSRTMPGVAKRVVFRPFAARDEFLSLLKQADCVLDPYHFSGGVTTYTTFSIGVPVLTLPGGLLRSRMTAGLYAQAGITGGVAKDEADLVEHALRWAANPDERRALGRQIEEGRSAWFEDASGVDAFADWLEAETRRS